VSAQTPDRLGHCGVDLLGQEGQGLDIAVSDTAAVSAQDAAGERGILIILDRSPRLTFSPGQSGRATRPPLAIPLTRSPAARVGRAADLRAAYRNRADDLRITKVSPCVASWPEAVALRSQTVLTGSGSPRHSYGGSGGGHPHFHLHTSGREPNLTIPHGQLGNRTDDAR
jgi:hypothetical protein